MKLSTTKKAERLYTEDKVKLMSKGIILKFLVRGDHENYEIHFDREQKKWSCTCKGFSLRLWQCSHIQAAMLLVRHEYDSLGL